MKLAVEKIIHPGAMFWGHSSLKGIFSEEQKNQLLKAEFADWLSSLYWLENIVGQYALRMSEISSDRKKVWLRVFKDEFNHQYLISSLLRKFELVPQAPNRLVAHAIQQVHQLKHEPQNDVLTHSVQTAQVFFEQYLDRIISYRNKHIYDQDARDAFDVILSDEQFHIAAGVHELKKKQDEEVNPMKTLADNMEKLFPFHLGRKILEVDQLRAVRPHIPTVVKDLLMEEN